MPNFLGLCYPFTHFKDEAWLNTMALCWDGVKRIVPSELPLHDSDTVKQLVDTFITSSTPRIRKCCDDGLISPCTGDSEIERPLAGSGIRSQEVSSGSSAGGRLQREQS